MKKLVLLFASLILFENSYSQTDVQNHQKYWFLRTKLRNDFMKVGACFDCKGYSIPFTIRGEQTQVQSNNTILYRHQLEVGDAISNLGIYIGVLSTEYKILNDNNQNTDSIAYELYCALNAVNRLDFNAESLIWGQAPSLNGFLMRDDIPGDFVSNNTAHFNYYQNDPIHPGFCSRIQEKQTTTNSDYQGFQVKGDKLDNQTFSQDHIISLLYGLRMLNQFVPPAASYNNINNNNAPYPYLYGETGTTFVNVAKNIVNRIIPKVRDANWNIMLPDNTQLSGHRGGNLQLYAYALAEIAGKINSGIPNNSPPATNILYHNIWSLGLGFTGWNTMAQSIGGKFDIVTQLAELSAACNCIFGAEEVLVTIGNYTKKVWKWINMFVGWVYSLVTVLIQQLTTVYNRNTSTGMLPNALHTCITCPQYDNNRIKYQQDHAVLAHSLLDNLTSPLALPILFTVKSRVKSRLDVCPCNGPFNFRNPTLGLDNWEAEEWSSQSTIEHTAEIGTDQKYWTGEYNGLDYMLMHNLYYLSTSNSSSIFDWSNRIVNFGIPLSNGLGSSSNPSTIGGFEYIIANNTLASNASTTYRAGKEIKLKDGFKASNGSSFHAKIEPFSCSGDTYTNQQMRNGNSDTATVNLYDDLGESIFTHYQPKLNTPQPINDINTFIRENKVSSKLITPRKIVNLNESIEIFPNPVTENLFIQINVTENNESFNIEFINSVGQSSKIFQGYIPVDNAIKIENTGFARGLYIVKVTSQKTGKSYEKKIIIQTK